MRKNFIITVLTATTAGLLAGCLYFSTALDNAEETQQRTQEQLQKTSQLLKAAEQTASKEKAEAAALAKKLDSAAKDLTTTQKKLSTAEKKAAAVPKVEIREVEKPVYIETVKEVPVADTEQAAQIDQLTAENAELMTELAAVETTEQDTTAPTIQNSGKNAVLDTDLLTVEYSQTTADSFDLIITPKKGLNVTPEWDLQATSNYSAAYLTGWGQDQAKKFHDTNWKNIAFSWDN